MMLYSHCRVNEKKYNNNLYIPANKLLIFIRGRLDRVRTCGMTYIPNMMLQSIYPHSLSRNDHLDHKLDDENSSMGHTGLLSGFKGLYLMLIIRIYGIMDLGGFTRCP